MKKTATALAIALTLAFAAAPAQARFAKKSSTSQVDKKPAKASSSKKGKH